MIFQPLRDIEAQLRTAEVETMRKYAEGLKGRYLEVGTKYGGSAYFVRCIADESAEVNSVDPKAILDQFKGRENEVGINWIKGRSTEVAQTWDKPIDLLFIDGDHGEGVPTAPIDDFNAWEKFVPKGGIIMMHDYHFDFPAVVSACDEIAKKHEVLEKPPFLANRQDTSMFVVRKC